MAQAQPQNQPDSDLSLDNLFALLLRMKNDSGHHPSVQAVAGTCAVLAKHIQRIGQGVGARLTSISQRLIALETQVKEIVEFLNAANAEPAPAVEPPPEAPKTPEPIPEPTPPPVPKLNAPKKKAGGAE